MCCGDMIKQFQLIFYEIHVNSNRTSTKFTVGGGSNVIYPPCSKWFLKYSTAILIVLSVAYFAGCILENNNHPIAIKLLQGN